MADARGILRSTWSSMVALSVTSPCYRLPFLRNVGAIGVVQVALRRPAACHSLPSGAFGSKWRATQCRFLRAERDSLQAARSNYTFSLHPGALHFLQRDEPTFIERYSGVAEVLVTLLVAAISGAFAFIKIYSIRRKNRVDEFFTAVIEIRNSVTLESSSDERGEAIADIQALRDRSFELLVDERLAQMKASESLSNLPMIRSTMLRNFRPAKSDPAL